MPEHDLGLAFGYMMNGLDGKVGLISDQPLKRRPGYRLVEFPTEVGELKGCMLFMGRLLLAFEEGLFYLDKDGETFKPIKPIVGVDMAAGDGK